MLTKVIPNVAVFILMLAVLWGALRWFERANLYFPTRAIEVTPANFGLEFTDVRFEAEDGVALHGWWVRPKDFSASTPVFLLSHGNGGNISHRMEKILCFIGLGAGVFIYDYRGYGESEGRPSEKGLYKDGTAAYHYLVKELSVPSDNIIFYGESLGGAVAVELARLFPTKGLVLESTFTSTVQMGKKIFPFLPVTFMVTHKYDSLSKIPDVKMPVLIMHSPDDEIVPYDFGQALFEAANQPKKFVQLSGGHNDGFFASKPIIERELKEFM